MSTASCSPGGPNWRRVRAWRAGGGGGPLEAAVRMADGDGERALGRADRRAADAHPPLDERAEHGEEAARGVLDVARVDAIGRHVRVAVEEVLARDADVVEPQAPVVDAVEPELCA